MAEGDVKESKKPRIAPRFPACTLLEGDVFHGEEEIMAFVSVLLSLKYFSITVEVNVWPLVLRIGLD